MMNFASRSWRRSAVAAAGGALLALAGWACGNGACPAGSNAASTGTSGTTEAGACEDPTAPVPPKTVCDPCGDIYKECPLPKSVSNDDGTYTTVYYYSAPTCQDAVCHYCVTSTMSEDPGVTGVP